MKILFVYPRPRDQWYKDYLRGEAPSTVFYGLPELHKLGFNVDFSDKAFSRFNLLKWIFFPFEKWIISKTGMGFKLDQAILLLSKACRADLIITTSDSSGLPFMLLKFLGFLKTPVFYTTIGLAGQYQCLGSNIVFNFYKKILSFADRVLVYSQIEAEVFTKVFNISAERIMFLPIGVDTQFYHPEKKSLMFVLAAGRDLGRDYRSYLEVARLFPKYMFKIICSARNLVNQVIPNNVSIEFDVNYLALRGYYWNSEFVVLPLLETQRASGQTVLLEAMACGKCVIVSSVRGLFQVYDLRSKINCIRTPVSSVSAMRKNVNLLLRNPRTAERIGRRARRLVVDRYSQKLYGEKLAIQINLFASKSL